MFCLTHTHYAVFYATHVALKNRINGKYLILIKLTLIQTCIMIYRQELVCQISSNFEKSLDYIPLCFSDSVFIDKSFANNITFRYRERNKNRFLFADLNVTWYLENNIISLTLVKRPTDCHSLLRIYLFKSVCVSTFETNVMSPPPKH